MMDDERFSLPRALTPESATEQRIVRDTEWQRGVLWGVPRPGHPEGQIICHIRDVLDNVDRFAPSNEPLTRARLRLIAMLHDACKGAVRARGLNHGQFARRLAERFTADETVLDVIEWHDEAYACWRVLDRGRRGVAHARADKLLNEIGYCLPVYLMFYRCDTMTFGKDRNALEWFETFVGR